MFLAGHPSQGCFGLQSHCSPCYFFNKASFYPSDFSFNESGQQPRLSPGASELGPQWPEFPMTFQNSSFLDMAVYRTRSITSDIVKNCTTECGNPCLDKTYEVRYEKIGDTDSFCDKDDLWCKNEKIIVTLKFNKFRLTRFVYQPKFASVEMFSYIGGYMGMWLGLSLVSLFDLYETICYLMYYPIARMRLKAKKKTLSSYPLKKKDFHDNLGFYY
ncbi:uncharacterized protein TNCV_2688661 [Trichonephila clavipes]|nr:uncharacterized protein TNCV_2688661 [Trichonephila clavipes]